MADEDKEKAEKVAAARKRYEELKKQKAKKDDAADKKKKSKKSKDKDDKDGEASKQDDGKADDAAEDDEGDDEEDDKNDEKRASLAEQSRTRSESFRKDSSLNAKLEQLEKENQRLQEELQKSMDVLKQTTSKSNDEAATKEKELEQLTTEVVELKRQNTNLQSSAKRRPSESHAKRDKDEISSQLASKTTAVENLELEISNIKHTLTQAEEKVSKLEGELKSEKTAHEATQNNLQELRTSLESKAGDEDPEARARDADARISLLNSDVAAAQKTAAEATTRAEALEKKVETLTNLNKEAQDKLKAPSNPRARKSVDGDDGGLEELEDEERKQLHARVRELEAEVYELRRGVWKDQRQAIDDHAMASPTAFSDVDLGSSYGAPKNRRQSSGYNAFANVINAFTGNAPAGRQRGQSSAAGGLMDDDDEDMDFDEDAFRKAQEDEAKSRLERIKETKRGLPQWKGWRVDLVDQRGGTMMGVFDV